MKDTGQASEDSAESTTIDGADGETPPATAGNLGGVIPLYGPEGQALEPLVIAGDFESEDFADEGREAGTLASVPATWQQLASLLSGASVRVAIHALRESVQGLRHHLDELFEQAIREIRHLLEQHELQRERGQASIDLNAAIEWLEEHYDAPSATRLERCVERAKSARERARSIVPAGIPIYASAATLELEATKELFAFGKSNLPAFRNMKEKRESQLNQLITEARSQTELYVTALQVYKFIYVSSGQSYNFNPPVRRVSRSPDDPSAPEKWDLYEHTWQLIRSHGLNRRPYRPRFDYEMFVAYEKHEGEYIDLLPGWQGRIIRYEPEIKGQLVAFRVVQDNAQKDHRKRLDDNVIEPANKVKDSWERLPDIVPPPN